MCAGLLASRYDKHTRTTPSPSRRKMFAVESASAASTRAGRPWAETSCANIVAAASSRGVRPAVQRIARSPRHSDRSSSLSHDRNDGERRGIRQPLDSCSSFRVHDCISLLRLDVGLIGEVAHELAHGAANLGLANPVQNSASCVGLSKLKAPHRDLVVISGESPLLEELLGLFGCLSWIASEHPLIEDLGGRQRWPIAEHHVKKLEALHVPPEND